MSWIREKRLALRGELEAPSALRRFGSGWLSGVLGLVLGLAGLGLVVAIRLPGAFSIPEAQGLYHLPVFRIGLSALLLAAFALSALSLTLRSSKILGICGVIPTLLAVTLGGSEVTQSVDNFTPFYLGLDFFVLRILFTAALFIPLERVFAQWADQGVFRPEWREDLFYFLVSSLLVQMLTFFTYLPANTILAVAPLTELRAWVGSLPFVVQFLAIMLLTDIMQYWVHRLFHIVPWLWKFHSVHHSARGLDWIAGARMHVLEIIALRAITVIPMFVLGFDTAAVNLYILVVYLYATFVHANINWRFPLIERFIVTPRFHHWHHGIETEAIDVNFAVHFPLLDRVFGTYYLPKDKWPTGYGIPGHPVPLGYIAQLRYPFQWKRADREAHQASRGS
jgi:sterol desaturase/sphingolipid hydroxylase (fatty acid hydroxylase superfamily)